MPLFRVPESGLFRADNLAWVMAGLILFVVANVTAYSRRYLAGDRKQLSHHLWVLLLGSSVLCMVFADQLLVLLIAWTISNLLLIRLMIHKTLDFLHSKTSASVSYSWEQDSGFWPKMLVQHRSAKSYQRQANRRLRCLPDCS